MKKHMKGLVLASVITCFGVATIGAAPYSAGGGAASGGDSVAIGAEAKTTNGLGLIAVGRGAKAEVESEETSGFAMAIGRNSKATKVGSVAMGGNATANGKRTTAAGTEAMATAEKATVFGAGSQATGIGSSVLGADAKAKDTGTVAVGGGAIAGKGDNTVTGAIAVGSGANSTDNESIAIGAVSKADKAGATAMGARAQATGITSTSIGAGSNVSAWNGTSVGARSNIKGNYSSAVGTDNNIEGILSGAFGYKNIVAKRETYVLGNEINATQNNSVILGSKSTDRAATAEKEANLDGLTYGGFAGIGSAANGVVSVGLEGKERQIINVAAGKISENSTDAINGSQLHATQKVVGAIANSMVGILGGDAKVGKDGKLTMSDIGGTGKTTIHEAIGNVKDAVDSVGTKVTGLETTVGSLGEKVTGLDTKVGTLGGKVTGLETQMGSMGEKVNGLEENVGTLNDKIGGLENAAQQIDTRLSGVEGEVRQVGALGAALGALKPLQYDPAEPSQFMVGVGTYRSSSAIALGLAHYKNESTLFHAGFSWANGGKTHLMANGGITWKFGYRSEERNVREEAYKKGPISSVYALEEEVVELRAQVKYLMEEMAAMKGKQVN